METLWQILAVLSLMACGFLARRRGLLSETGTSELTRLLIAIIYPALIITTMPRLSLRDLGENWVMPVMAMAIALTGLVLGALALRFLRGVPKEEARAFLFQSVFNNYLFLPLPLVLLLWGRHGVALLVFSSVMFEAILWTLGVFLLTSGMGVRERMKSLLNPAFCALVLSLLFVAARDGLGWREAEALGGEGAWAGVWNVFLFAAGRMGEATVAVSMLVAGSRMATLHPKAMLNGRVWLVAGVRLVAVPALIIPLLWLAPMETMARGVLTVVAVMPCAVASVFFSERFGGDREFIAGALLLTHLAALVTVPLFLAWTL